jgi:NADP-dependent 3-hydroxy acid dehydrogenase YdfG
MNTFSNKVAWVTGASSGIGAELCRQLAERGATVVLSARKLDALNEVRSTMKNPERHVCLPLDLEDQSNFKELAEKVFTEKGSIDFLFNNGGLSQR